MCRISRGPCRSGRNCIRRTWRRNHGPHGPLCELCYTHDAPPAHERTAASKGSCNNQQEGNGRLSLVSATSRNLPTARGGGLREIEADRWDLITIYIEQCQEFSNDQFGRMTAFFHIFTALNRCKIFNIHCTLFLVYFCTVYLIFCGCRYSGDVWKFFPKSDVFTILAVNIYYSDQLVAPTEKDKQSLANLLTSSLHRNKW